MSHAILPELVETAAEAFGRSWTFIQHDPLLAGCDRAQLKAELARVILAHADAQQGDDPVRLANRAIGSLREKIVGQRFGLVRRPDMGRQWTAATPVESSQHAMG